MPGLISVGKRPSGIILGTNILGGKRGSIRSPLKF
jgi:hypothetical protein